MQGEKPITIKELIDKGKMLLVSTQSSANTAAINSYDTISNQLLISVAQTSSLTKEVDRLKLLCAKNGVDYEIPPSKPVKLPENQVSPPEPEKIPETTLD